MADKEHGHIEPAWWLQDEGHFLLPLNRKVIYQHRQRDNAPVTAQSMETLFHNVLDDNPADHQLFFNTRPSVFDSSDEDGTFEDGYESNEERVQRFTDTFCGLRRNFLCDPPQLALRPIADPYCTKPKPHRGPAEEAERIGQQLVNEEEQTKRKAEKRRQKKKRQKERRRQQKLEKENRSEERNEESVNAKPVLPHCEECVDGVRECGDVDANMNCEAAVSPQHVALESKLPSGAAGNVPGLRVAAKVSRVKPEREAGSAVANDRSASQSEDEWDMSSSFVSKAANQIKRKLNIKPKAEKKEIEKKKAEKKPEHPVDSTALNDKILELAVQGNSMANTGRYEEAVALFTEAIKHDPKEYRLFGNRSYCYERLQQYSRALSDAHTALTLNPSWPKGYFRKARALAGVKKYAEAIEAFQQVLEIDDSCEDAEFELLQIQTKLMMERGFTQQQCEETLKLCGSFERALEALSSSAQKAGSSHVSSSACLSDGDDKDFVRVKKHSTQNKHKDKAPAPLPAQQPCKLFPIWIGNVTTRISEDSLRVMFESVGAIHSVRMLQDRFCAFINFTTKEGAERAIAELQGMELEGTKLVIRYPDNSYRTLGGATRGGSAY